MTPTRRPAILFGLAGLIVAAHLAARAAGLADHTSAIVGMPPGPASNVLGPLHVAIYLLLVAVAPVLALAATIDTVLALRRR